MRTEGSSFPAPFQSYKPPCMKVYGSICMTPENKILMVRGRATGKWSFPKGKKFRNEKYLECALRETYEETGIQLSTYQPSGYYKLSHGAYYSFDVPSELPTFPVDIQEVSEARWLEISELLNKNVNVDVSYFLQKFCKRRAEHKDWAVHAEECIEAIVAGADNQSVMKDEGAA